MYSVLNKKKKGVDIIVEAKQKRKPRVYTDEFRQKVVQLYRNEERKCDICHRYDISALLLDCRINQANSSDYSNEEDKYLSQQQELLELQLHNQQLEMENNILKQAMLILARRMV